MSPLALSLLGVESIGRRRLQQGETEGETNGPEAVQLVYGMRPIRALRRPTSYYNPFQTVCSTSNDNPPLYAVVSKHRPAQPRHLDHRTEVLPKYSSTVSSEGKFLLQLESINPLYGVSESEWREVYVVLQGTLLSFHRAKDAGPGRLLRSYTLQHAEVGLAPDTQHTVLVPQTRFAHLVPSAARRRAWQKDPDMFKPVRQHILRLRVENDQILLAEWCEDRIHLMINAISAGIDISCAIDERSIPRQCTVPRRRRRPRVNQPGDLNDPTLLAEQERILRHMYPGFAERTSPRRPELERTVTGTTDDVPTEHVQTPTREEDDLDLAAIREDLASPAEPTPMESGHRNDRPPMSRHITASSVNSTLSGDMIYATSPANFGEAGKWQPPHTRTPQQVQRYVRRCLPLLLAESIRASDILICNGKRVKINWRMELLEEWELQPPSYKSHNFTTGQGLERTRSVSQNSTSGSATQENARASDSVLGAENEDQIERAETVLSNLDMSKITTATDKGAAPEVPAPKTQEPQHPGAEIHGVIFCF